MLHAELTPQDVKRLLDERMSTFTLSYWNDQINNPAHLEIVSRAKSVPDYRLLHDSWLWRNLLQAFGFLDHASSILELLPGWSLTIPLALQSAGYGGTLYRLNDAMPIALPRGCGFTEQWIKGQLAKASISEVNYSLIVGNHIIEDLLLELYEPNSIKRLHIYADRHLSYHTWDQLSQSASLKTYIDQIVGVFLSLIRKMSPGASLILRQYPSTSALLSGNLNWINLEMSAYFKVASALSDSHQARVFFQDISMLNSAPASKYPNSVLVLKRLPKGS